MTVFDDLSPAVRSLLEAAGWRPGRTVPVDAWDEVLRREGHLLSPLAAEILTGLGGLEVHPGPAAKFRQPLLFEPELAGSGAYDIAEQFEAQYGQSFYPIAEWISASVVYIGHLGKVVSYDDIERLDIADSFAEALEVILLGVREPRVLPD